MQKKFSPVQKQKNWDGCKVLTFYTTKGGVLKTTLAFHLARTLALWGLRVCAIGLDLQGDLSKALGIENGITEDMPLDDVLPILDRQIGLGDVFFQRQDIMDVVQKTDLENLDVIAETSELSAVNDHLSQKNRREYWLKEKVVAALADLYDVIIFDCSPSWNLLATNALVASDCLISPLECKITNFRNLPLFRALVGEFKQEMQLGFEHIFVPTRFRAQVRLSRDIRDWYSRHLTPCLGPALKECALSEEAVAVRRTMMEYNFSKSEAHEMLQLIENIFSHVAQKEDLLGKASRIEFTTQHQNLTGVAQWPLA